MWRFWKSINWPKISGITNVVGIALCVGYALLFGFQPKQAAHSQTAYIPGTTVAMDQSTCAGATPTSPKNVGTDGTTLVCGPYAGASYGARIVTDTSGLAVWTFPASCQHGGNIPLITAIAEGPSPQANSNVNVQIEGAPSATQVSFRVTKTTSTVVALLGLTITVSVTGTSIGATSLDATCVPQ